MMTSKTGRASFSSSSSALLAVPYSITPGESRNFDLLASSHVISPDATSDPAYLYIQLKSAEWIKRYGLKSQKLTFDQILQQIGFKRVESFDPVLNKNIGAKYAGNLYHEIQHDNGDRYVLTCRPDKLREYHHRLIRMLNLLRKRLIFITSGSRRLFGLISESIVCLICDCKTFDHRIFNQYQSALTSLLKEQISKIKRFNIIWVSDDNEQFREQPVDVSSTNIDQAIDWICDRKCPRNKISITSTSEAVLKAYKNNAQSIYLLTEGDSSDSAREILRDNVVKTRLSLSSPIPFHIVSLFCHNNDTQTFLRSLAQSSDGSYFCYKIKGEVSDLKASSNLSDPTRILIQDDKLQLGTNALLPISEYPIDITIMYKEIIQCQSIIDRLEKILGFVRNENQTSIQSLYGKSADNIATSGESHFQRSLVVQSSALFSNEENEMSSADWLQVYGIDAQKLDYFSVLHLAAFRHCDGVVRLLKPPYDSDQVTASTPANPQDKLINAIYCDQFAHVTWPDGTIRHVHVTPELYRDYERRIKSLLEKIRARLLWLKKGSREVFGTVLENNIYILIDSSKSMEHHLGFVKEKLRLLIQDQLAAKERINMVAFNSTIHPWRDRLTKISDSTAYSQLIPWIDGLTADGSTNTLAALRFALADPATEAIYLLTDGRPDQSERHILSQVQYRQVVAIHTIAFNCQDQIANQFLYDLAKQTGGRFHAFKYGLEKETSVEIPESEDVGNLKRELVRGEKELERIAELRDECLGKAWARDHIHTKTTKYKKMTSNSTSIQIRTNDATVMRVRTATPSMAQQINTKKRLQSPQKAKQRARSVTTFKNRQSIIDLNPDQWLLPETKDYLLGNDNKDKAKSDTEHDNQTDIPADEIKKTPTAYDKVRTYLKKNSLLAKGLTIFDVLYPTTKTIRDPSHVQIIDRFVLEKVWNNILPLTYGRYVGKFHLVNHYAVDLERYEEKLRKLISEYYEFTAKFIWDELSDDDKRKVGPYLHWNTLSKDEQNRFKETIDKEKYTNHGALVDFAWEQNLDDDSRKDFLSKPPIYQDNNQKALKKALKDAELEAVLKGVTRMDKEINRAIKFLEISTDLRQLQRGADVKLPPAPPSLPRDPNNGLHVICRYDIDGFFYAGKIKKRIDDQLIIIFTMGIEQEILGHTLIPIGGAVAQPPLYVKDFVLVRQKNGDREFWAPGILLVLPAAGCRPPPLYMVEIFLPCPRRVYVPRRSLIKINSTLFKRILLYIQDIHNPTPTPRPLEDRDEIDIEELIRQSIQLLTNKVNYLNETYEIRYNELKVTLELQMEEIRKLRDRRPKPIEPSEKNRKKKKRPPSTSPHPVPPVTGPSEDILQPDTIVFALWLEDDRLFYESIILDHINNSNNYHVERSDLPGIQSIISRDEIYLRTERRYLSTFKINTFILIEYPNDARQCWCPAVIRSHDHDSSRVHVRFYDCVDHYISNTQYAIQITQEKFQHYTSSRIEFEKSLRNQVIVGLNNDTKTYILGTIIERIETGHRYLIRWCDDTQNEQDEQHLFGAFNRRNHHYVNQLVLAIDIEQYIYKAARVTRYTAKSKTLTVQFIGRGEDQNEEIEVPAETTFAITQHYYEVVIKNLRPNQRISHSPGSYVPNQLNGLTVEVEISNTN